MPLTPLDIRQKEFSRTFRGYDEDEVNDFLDQIIKDYETLIGEKADLEAQIKAAKEKLGHFSNIETTLNKSILVAQQTAEEVKQNANKESKLIVMEAKKNADRIINEALEKSRKVTLNIEELKREANVYRTRFQMLIEAQLELLKSEDWKSLTSAPDNERNNETQSPATVEKTEA
ncbi:MAG: DivIVA domain-containing protein [Sporolactobacillus sp.]|nr:DivIVA domain-containing protein [Sporolactobacillus sp.]MCI1881693.1 DivIVA domain-containing protein [Sporolactobacillus sp.]